MALAGIVRSNPSLLQNLLKAESVLAQRSILHRSSENPNSQLPKNFSTAPGTKEKKVKLPLDLFGMSGNYASALYLSATKANILDKVEGEINDLIEASKRSPTFSLFIKDLSVPAETRVKALMDIASAAKFSDISKNFLAILAENGRLRYIENINKKFTELTMAYKGEVKAIVTTVIPLPAEEEKQLKETLQDIIGQGKTVKLEQKIDPNILGGLVVEFERKVFDMSIRTRAKQMERFLREPINLDNI